MTTVNAARSNAVVARRPYVGPVKVKANSNDPTLRANVLGNNTVHVRGTASNNGIVPSRISFQFDGQTILIPVHRGDTGADVQRRLEKRLPDGYGIRPLPTLMHSDGATFQIVRARTNDPMYVAQGFQTAQTAGTQAGKRISKTELRQILAVAKEDGFTRAEKAAFAKSWAATFDGQDFAATKEAQREYARIQKKFDLPKLPIR